MPKITFVDAKGNRQDAEVQHGVSVLDAARQFNIDVEGRCEGSLACATCHVIVESDHFEALDAMTEDEQDMLDLAVNVSKTSRLCCQIIMRDELDGLQVRIPVG